MKSVDLEDGFERKQHPRGYIYIKIAGAWVSEHRFIMEQKLGRPLRKYEEVVHHKDHDPSNNSLDNLEVLSPSEHSKLHSSHKVRVCYVCGKEFELYEYEHAECDGFSPIGYTAEDLFDLRKDPSDRSGEREPRGRPVPPDTPGTEQDDPVPQASQGTHEHQWPAELHSGARCEVCGIKYGQWSVE